MDDNLPPILSVPLDDVEGLFEPLFINPKGDDEMDGELSNEEVQAAMAAQYQTAVLRHLHALAGNDPALGQHLLLAQSRAKEEMLAIENTVLKEQLRQATEEDDAA